MALLNNPKAAQREVDKWNELYPVGQAVTVCLDRNGTMTTSTRSEAQLLSGHSPVIWLEGISGCYLLSRVTAITGGASHG